MLISGLRDCDKVPADTGGIFKASVDALRSELAKIANGELDTRALYDPSSGALKAAIAERPCSAMWLLFSGHGEVRNSGSALCLKDGAFSVAELITHVEQTASAASLWLDACESAHVAVHESKIPISIVSASPARVHSALRETIVTGQVALALRRIRPGTNAVITDQDLFQTVNLAVSDTKTIFANNWGEPPRMKLRRQAAEPVPLMWTVPNATSAAPRARRLADMSAHAPDSVLVDSPDGLQLRYPGAVSPRERQRIRRDGLVVVPCIEDQGQCFGLP
ncbi:MAG TPA: hypothetical protein VI072_03870 [Polyangiaceae bacterium]